MSLQKSFIEARIPIVIILIIAIAANFFPIDDLIPAGESFGDTSLWISNALGIILIFAFGGLGYTTGKREGVLVSANVGGIIGIIVGALYSFDVYFGSILYFIGIDREIYPVNTAVFGIWDLISEVIYQIMIIAILASVVCAIGCFISKMLNAKRKSSESF